MSPTTPSSAATAPSEPQGAGGSASLTAAARPRGLALRTLLQWHWISSAICLVGLLLFAATGLTLNNARWIPAQPQVLQRTWALPAAVAATVRPPAPDAAPTAPGATLPGPLQDWLVQQVGPEVQDRPAEWSDDEIYLSLPRPGGDAWLRISRSDGQVAYERTDRGWIAYFNDLHKGRHTGKAWSWFLDLFALACVVFSVTGLLILHRHAAQRPSTWPLVAGGLVVPWLLALLFIH